MNIKYTINFRNAQRVACVMLAALLFVASAPMLLTKHASADQLANRSITMSDSAPSSTAAITAGAGSGKGVTYRVTFTTSVKADSLVIDFCQQDPIINDTCGTLGGFVGPTGFAATSPAVGVVNSTDWSMSVVANGAGNQAVKLKDTTANAHPLSPGGTTLSPNPVPQSFDLTGITNPDASTCPVSGNTSCSFFARIYTYNDNAYGGAGTGWQSATNVGTCPSATTCYVDYGGIALSTSTVITITARVQESLSFCVTRAVPDNWTDGGGPGPNAHECTAAEVSANPPNVTLGHGTPTAVLDSQNVDDSYVAANKNDVYTQLSTNATNGAVINMHSSNNSNAANTSCGGLSADNGVTCAIPAATCGGSPPCLIAAGTAAFGVMVTNRAAPSGVTAIGSVTVNPTYWNGTDSPTAAANTLHFGMDYVSGNATGVGSTFGSTIATSTGPTYRFNNELTFGATAALTTPAGIYTANLSLIATGTF